MWSCHFKNELEQREEKKRPLAKFMNLAAPENNPVDLKQ